MPSGELLFGAGTDPGQVMAALSTSYRVLAGPPFPVRRVCLDTVDWRLHRAGLTLQDVRRGRRRSLLLAGAGGDLSAPAPARSWPTRVESLPASPVRERIASAVGVRALLPLAEVGVRTVEFQVLDDEDKTRVRLQVDQQRLIGDHRAPLPLRVLIAPLRGYERDGVRCTSLLTEAMNPLGDLGSAVAAAFAAAGHVPGKPAVAQLELDPLAPATESMARVLRRSMDVIDAVRPGVLADVDPEFLHELRTSVRAIRSLLRIGADLMSTAQMARFAADFAWLGRLTTPLRDLDVWLLELDKRALDGSGLEALEPLYRQLAAQRRRALITVREGLQSPRGSTLSADWRAALDTLASGQTAGPTTLRAAAMQADAEYRRIRKAARGVTGQTNPDELHRLRRRCKRMRYLLDGYASVYATEPHRWVLSALKGLQDCLGEIQDVDVQRGQLTELAVTLNRRGTDPTTLLDIGALRDRMLPRDALARQKLAARLSRFCSAETQAQVAALGSVE